MRNPMQATRVGGDQPHPVRIPPLMPSPPRWSFCRHAHRGYRTQAHNRLTPCCRDGSESVTVRSGSEDVVPKPCPDSPSPNRLLGPAGHIFGVLDPDRRTLPRHWGLRPIRPCPYWIIGTGLPAVSVPFRACYQNRGVATDSSDLGTGRVHNQFRRDHLGGRSDDLALRQRHGRASRLKCADAFPKSIQDPSMSTVIRHTRPDSNQFDARSSEENHIGVHRNPAPSWPRVKTIQSMCMIGSWATSTVTVSSREE